MGISNHARYYGMPHQIIFPSDCDKHIIEKLVTAYNIFLTQHSAGSISVMIVEKSQKERVNIRRKLIIEYKNKYIFNTKINNNMVVELFQKILDNTP